MSLIAAGPSWITRGSEEWPARSQQSRRLPNTFERQGCRDTPGRFHRPHENAAGTRLITRRQGQTISPSFSHATWRPPPILPIVSLLSFLSSVQPLPQRERNDRPLFGPKREIEQRAAKVAKEEKSGRTSMRHCFGWEASPAHCAVSGLNLRRLRSQHRSTTVKTPDFSCVS